MTTTTLLLIAILVMMLVAAPVVALLKDFLPAQVEKAAKMDENENRIYVLHSEVHEAQARLSSLTAHRNQRSAENQRIDSEARKAEKGIRDIETQPPLFIHEVGEPRASLTKFLVNINLTKADGESRAAPVNPIWRCANMAEVWASTQEEAKQLVEITFPFKLGYNKSFVRQPPPGAKPAKAPCAPAEAGGGGAEASAPPPPTNLPNSPGRELRRPSMAPTDGTENTAAPQ
jgi:hypothetical protein